ncbi:MAG: phytanoyl-CoA dioxygenase family protein [Candidatus Latescibacterota bacterium]|nr:phytanoyl-CoA dioxygenase family protein [Candidatus Latescibacterota bacterium]
MNSAVSQEQIKLFQQDGFFVLESVIPETDLELLRGQCQRFIDKMDARMDEEGNDILGINHRGQRYFIANCFREEPRLRAFLFGDLMADICRVTLGDTFYLFWEQYVVKGAEMGMKFSWHQDSGYVGHPEHKPYLTCWCALDDMSEANGTVQVMPFSHIGIRTFVKHEVEEVSNDKVGYFGDDPGVLVECPAGSIVVFTSVNFHCSGVNTTDRLRRSYLAQYSCEPLLSADRSKLWGNAEPFLRDGESVVGGPPPDLPSR